MAPIEFLIYEIVKKQGAQPGSQLKRVSSANFEFANEFKAVLQFMNL